jgi:hypothetical protein
MTKSLRLNARLDEGLAKKVEFLKRKTSSTTTEVLRRAIEHYYASTASGSRDGAKILQETGLIGCAAGPTDLSTRYKEDLSELLAKKS